MVNAAYGRFEDQQFTGVGAHERCVCRCRIVPVSNVFWRRGRSSALNVDGVAIVWAADASGTAPIVSDFIIDSGGADTDLINGDVHTVITGSLVASDNAFPDGNRRDTADPEQPGRRQSEHATRRSLHIGRRCPEPIPPERCHGCPHHSQRYPDQLLCRHEQGIQH